jgi:2-oxoglutarate dehydrogenase E1 component
MLSRRHLTGSMKPKHSLRYVGRVYSAAPAAGYLSVHLAQQRALVEEALALHTVEELKQRSA